MVFNLNDLSSLLLRYNFARIITRVIVIILISNYYFSIKRRIRIIRLIYIIKIYNNIKLIVDIYIYILYI